MISNHEHYVEKRITCVPSSLTNLPSSGSSVSVVDASPEGELTLVQNQTYALEGPGPNPERQEAPHPHEAILDPFGLYVLVPDLGADLVRVYKADADTLELTPVTPLTVKPGSGPRHGAFVAVTSFNVYFYLVSELANTITGYHVSYGEDNALGFREIFTIPTHGEPRELPAKTGAAEIVVSVSLTTGCFFLFQAFY